VEKNFLVSEDSTSLKDVRELDNRTTNKINSIGVQLIADSEDKNLLIIYLNQKVFEVLEKHLKENMKVIEKLFILRDFGHSKNRTRGLSVEEKCEILLPEVLWIRRYAFLLKDCDKTALLKKEIHDLIMLKEGK